MKKTTKQLLFGAFLLPMIANAQLSTPNGAVGTTTNPLTTNVGVGTTTPTEKLDVRGNIKSTANVNAVNFYGTGIFESVGFRFHHTYGDFQMKRGAADPTFKTVFSPTADVLFFNTGGSFTNGVLLQGTNGTYINFKNGKIGIGHPDPYALLDLVSADPGIGSGIFLKNTSTSGRQFSIASRTDGPNSSAMFAISDESVYPMGLTRFMIAPSGNVGIGTLAPDEKLTVKGAVHAEEIRVDLLIPADYVFEKYFTGTSELKDDYTMPTLEEVEEFIKANHHLPEVPSAKEMQEQGVKLGEMTNLLLQKTEELTLYLIEQQKQIELLKEQNKLLQEQVEALKNKTE